MLITSKQVAQLCHVSKEMVSIWLHDGKLHGEKDCSGRWLVEEEEVRAFNLKRLRRRMDRRRPLDFSLERMTRALERLDRKLELLEEIKELMFSMKVGEPKPEWKPGAPYGVNPVEEKEL